MQLFNFKFVISDNTQKQGKEMIISVNNSYCISLNINYYFNSIQKSDAIYVYEYTQFTVKITV